MKHLIHERELSLVRFIAACDLAGSAVSTQLSFQRQQPHACQARLHTRPYNLSAGAVHAAWCCEGLHEAGAHFLLLALGTP